MKMTRLCSSCLFYSLLIFPYVAASFYSNDKVLLSDVKVITLHQNQMTTARRSSPVPQLKRVGGSAPYSVNPKVVQCINQGSDGYDVQWECKADLDNSYRFGRVEVSCEGYDYPNDPYILKGSCGLEYSIDYTEEGMNKGNSKSHNNYNNYNYNRRPEGGLKGVIILIAIIVGMYVIYKTCLDPRVAAAPGQFPHNNPPPPYGFRPEYMPNQDAPPPYDSCGTDSSYTSYNQDFTNFGAGSTRTAGMGGASSGTGGGGFWTGAATGGLLGYLFGSRNNQYRQNTFPGGWGTGYGSGYDGPQTHNYHHYDHSPRSGGSASQSSGSRTASGFGGTTRR